MQRCRPFGRREIVFRELIDAPAMNRPEPAFNGIILRITDQAAIYQNEVQGRPNPGNADQQMKPAQQQFKPL